MTTQIKHTFDGGIERIEYIARTQHFSTPILLQHGMFHSAQCWKLWQTLLAEYGWHSISYSLPGHGRSPVQRSIRWCTLGYYYRFLQAEIRRFPQPPIVFGHSMGGGLLQWHLRYGTDPLAAAVLVAPWTAHSMVGSCSRAIQLDPVGGVLNLVTLTSTAAVRNPYRTGRAFLTPGAVVTPEELYTQLGPESLLVLFQYQPPFWKPRSTPPELPLLWLAGECDSLIAEQEERTSAHYYGADYRVIPHAGHNLMMEQSYQDTLDQIHQWLLGIIQPHDQAAGRGKEVTDDITA